jgi:hypothetical protein
MLSRISMMVPQKSVVPSQPKRTDRRRRAYIMSASARNRMKNWEVIADNLKKAGWSYGYVSATDSNGRTIWIADAHRGDGKRFIVRSDELLTAFVELQREAS